MSRNSEAAESTVSAAGGGGRRRLSPLQARLRAAAGALGVLNLVGLYFLILPPGGTQQDLEAQNAQVTTEGLAAQTQLSRTRSLSAHVETASEQTSAFADKYFLPRRTAYVTVLEEIQRMAKASGLQERDAGVSEEPIEGSADLTLLNITANYEGSNDNLMKFLHEADHSPMLLVLDMLTASPQQHNDLIDATIRFQAIVREPAVGGAVLTPAPASGTEHP